MEEKKPENHESDHVIYMLYFFLGIDDALTLVVVKIFFWLFRQLILPSGLLQLNSTIWLYFWLYFLSLSRSQTVLAVMWNWMGKAQP
jgi:hypothetical protein